jgi:DNA-binding LacI/PurR family transcriptional regulator
MTTTDDARQPLRRPARIKDVADLAGVSLKTVSNVVNGRSVVKSSTRERVEAAISTLGYRPSLAARSLQSGRSHVITLAVPELTNPYFASLAHAVIGEAAEHGFTVLTDVTSGDPEHERRVASGYHSLFHDGIIFSPLSIGVDEILSEHDETPLVTLGERISGARIDHVAIDNVSSARQLTEHLLSLGHRTIAFLGHQPERMGTAVLRERGYRDALEAAGIAVDPDLLLPVSAYLRRDGAEAVERILARIGSIDAIVAGNDLLAIGAMHVFANNGIRVPEDIAIGGWDNTPDGAYFSPSLTTIAPDDRMMARLAVRALITRLDDPDREAEEFVVDHRLLVRQSTGHRA